MFALLSAAAGVAKRSCQLPGEGDRVFGAYQLQRLWEGGTGSGQTETHAAWSQTRLPIGQNGDRTWLVRRANCVAVSSQSMVGVCVILAPPGEVVVGSPGSPLNPSWAAESSDSCDTNG
ncbi:Hypothetical predicted protein [Pelobates cultripes]|uniref:Uncharacterized protein n=1 Tax=Pelobates cultripes TaxID=61616 RepID=A0AAD1W4K4_PELCU|nr:Hypothetical predicted protein [Pelobates cultripes]